MIVDYKLLQSMRLIRIRSSLSKQVSTGQGWEWQQFGASGQRCRVAQSIGHRTARVWLRMSVSVDYVGRVVVSQEWRQSMVLMTRLFVWVLVTLQVVAINVVGLSVNYTVGCIVSRGGGRVTGLLQTGQRIYCGKVGVIAGWNNPRGRCVRVSGHQTAGCHATDRQLQWDCVGLEMRWWLCVSCGLKSWRLSGLWVVCVALFGLSFPCLNRVLLHSDRSVDVMKFIIQTTRIANGLSQAVAPP